MSYKEQSGSEGESDDVNEDSDIDETYSHEGREEEEVDNEPSGDEEEDDASQGTYMHVLLQAHVIM